MSDQLHLRIKMSALVRTFQGQDLHKILRALCYSMGENLYAEMYVTKLIEFTVSSLAEICGLSVAPHSPVQRGSTSWFCHTCMKVH